MGAIEIVGGCLLLVAAFIIIVLVILQDVKQTNISGTITGSNQNDSYYGRNSGRTLDATLAKITKICAAAFFLITILANVFTVFFK